MHPNLINKATHPFLSGSDQPGVRESTFKSPIQSQVHIQLGDHSLARCLPRRNPYDKMYSTLYMSMIARVSDSFSLDIVD